jgi:hypothetical protein
MKEVEIQRTILDYLAYRKVFAWRNNSGATVIQTPTARRFIRFGAVGSPDIIAIKDGKVYGLEVKTPTGKLSPNQETFRDGMTKAGGIYQVVRSLEEVQALGL